MLAAFFVRVSSSVMELGKVEKDVVIRVFEIYSEYGYSKRNNSPFKKQNQKNTSPTSV